MSCPSAVPNLDGAKNGGAALSLACRLCSTPLRERDATGLRGTAGHLWYRCGICDCLTSESQYDAALYTEALFGKSRAEDPNNQAGFAEFRRYWTSNVGWLEHDWDHRGKTVLDVGCAEGAGLSLFHSHGWDAWGWDAMRAALGWCAANVPEVERDKVIWSPEFDTGDLPFAFDAIHCRETIEHVPNPLWFFGQLVEAAKRPGGRVQIQTPLATDNASDSWAFSSHLTGFTYAALVGLFERHGLRILTASEWRIGACLTGERR